MGVKNYKTCSHIVIFFFVEKLHNDKLILIVLGHSKTHNSKQLLFLYLYIFFSVPGDVKIIKRELMTQLNIFISNSLDVIQKHKMKSSQCPEQP